MLEAKERRVQIMPDGSKIYPTEFPKVKREPAKQTHSKLSYEDLRLSLKAVDELMQEHKLALASEDESSLADCLQLEGRMYERLHFMANGVLRLER